METTTHRYFEVDYKEREVAARIALIVVANDEIGDRRFRAIVEPLGVEVLTTRVVYLDDEVDENGEFQLLTRFDKAAEAFPPTERLDMLAFSCTSGTVATGKEKMLSILEEARPGLLYTTPGVAALRAAQHMGVKRMALLAPYDDILQTMFLDFFGSGGVDITSHARLAPKGGEGWLTDHEIASITPEFLIDSAKKLLAEEPADAIYMSCAALDVNPHFEMLEREIGVPVLASTQVFAWDALRLLGIKSTGAGPGQLFAG